MSNPISKILLNKKLQDSVLSVKRVDEAGTFYEMDYTGNYYGGVQLPIKAIGLMKKGGCSAFVANTPDGKVITGRNYDMPHFDEAKNLMGVNLVLRCNPVGKYKSIAGVDTVWLSKLGIKVKPGCFDDGKTNITGLALVPYLCMDGMNEKGFTVSILYLDIKDGEHAVNQTEKGKKNIIITMLVRFMLDSCANIHEAVALAQRYNLVNTLGSDYHLFVSDANGEAAVLEWRYNTFKATYQDCVTNFYVGQDDAEDCYYTDGLKEKWVAPKKKLKREYHYGYGHGYERFKTLSAALDKKIVKRSKPYRTEVTKEEARDILASVAQDYDGLLTSYTQYTVVYNNTDLTADYWLTQNYDKAYSFDL